MTKWTYEHDGLTVVVSAMGRQGRIELRGVSDSRKPAAFFDSLMGECSSKLKEIEVTIDLTGLDYMNSATVKSLIEMVKLLDQNGPPVSVVFRDTDWQRTHRACMLALARTLNNTRIQ